jgi:glutathione synthase/RimK-type ligase-like ATP-grasp enzyme
LGIDLLPACNGETYLLEVNAVPGWKGTASATGIDVAGWMIDAAVEQVEKSRDSRKSPAT